MDGKKYEQKVALYLRSHGYRKVRITKASNDYGVDIICYKRRSKYAVQCKYYSRPVGVHAVQQVVGGMKYYDCDKAMVVSNNSYTRQAIELAASNDVELIEGYKGKSNFRKVYLNIICVLILADLMLTEWRIYAILLFAIYLIFQLFGVYVRRSYRRQIDEESNSEDDYIEDGDG